MHKLCIRNNYACLRALRMTNQRPIVTASLSPRLPLVRHSQLKFVFVFVFRILGSREADWSNLESEFLVGTSLDGDVLDGEGLQIFGLDFEDALSLCDVLDVGGLILVGKNSEFGIGVHAVVCNVLSDT